MSKERAHKAVNWLSLQHVYSRAVKPVALAEFARGLSLTVAALRALEVGWDGEAFTLPMRDGQGTIVGIQRRTSPRKCCVDGSQLGLFLPVGVGTNGCERLLICEGASDCAVLLAWGYEAIGRPNCNARADWLVEWCRPRAYRQVVIVADNDEPGIRGAHELQRLIPGALVIVPPTKDVRSWAQAGATRKDVERAIAETW
jgi:5S rRNA maturation endonuclease (ribonuclease M5)